MKNVEKAFYVAGHVVMAMLWGVWRVDRVSMARKGNPSGGIEYVPVTEIEGKELWRTGTRLSDAKLEQIMGGPVARALLNGREVVYRRGREDSDLDCIVSEILAGTPGKSPKDAWAIICEHESVVQADLKRMWPVVEALAQELMNKKELSEYEIRSIVRIAVNKLPEVERTWAISRLRNTPARS